MGAEGAGITAAIFSEYISFFLLTIAVVLFALSTMISCPTMATILDVYFW